MTQRCEWGAQVLLHLGILAEHAPEEDKLSAVRKAMAHGDSTDAKPPSEMRIEDFFQFWDAQPWDMKAHLYAEYKIRDVVRKPSKARGKKDRKSSSPADQEFNIMGRTTSSSDSDEETKSSEKGTE